MTTAQTDRIDRTIDIDAPPERVWRALTTAKELSEWFKVSLDGEIEAGREVWMTSLYPGHENIRFRVAFIELTPPTRFVWQWHANAVDQTFDYSKEQRTTVTFTLEPNGRGTRLTVSETGFDGVSLGRRAKAFSENSKGWAEVIVWIKQHVEHSR
jgi:uncharacterized protein YndB with AHSA1/START domain